MNSWLALAFALHHRPLSRLTPVWVRRAAWLFAAALMLAALRRRWSALDSAGSGAILFTVGIGEIAVAGLSVVAAVVYIVRGISADPADRLLAGALGGIVSASIAGVLFSIVRSDRMDDAGTMICVYSFWLLVGAAVARAKGNLRRP